MNDKYLVTGGLGFIGNELVRLLRNFGPVSIIDDRSRTASRIGDLNDIPVHQIDITNSAKLAATVAEVRPDIVFHLAAIHYIPECNADPERAIRINVESTLGLLRASSAAGVKHFVFASSGAVYADSSSVLTETSTVAPVDIYGWTKFHAEQLCAWHARAEGLRVTLCRLFNNYGPRETNAHIIPEILNQLRKGPGLHLGNITSRRDYIYTSDTARALHLLAHAPPDCGNSRVVNVSSGEHASVEEIVALIGDLLGWKVEVTIDPKRFRKADKQVQVGDVTLLKQLTGWKKQVNLPEGMRKLLEFEGFNPQH